MSQENVELVRRGTESVDAFWAMLDEHVVWDLRNWHETPGIGPVVPFFIAARGRDGKLLWWGMFDSRNEALESVGLSE